MDAIFSWLLSNWQWLVLCWFAWAAVRELAAIRKVLAMQGQTYLEEVARKRGLGLDGHPIGEDDEDRAEAI